MRNPNDAPAPAIPSADRICLFLDFDGTLVEFTDDPHAVRPDAQLLQLLRSLQVVLDGAVAVVSGRRLEELDALLHPLRLPVAGLHGLERRNALGQLHLAAVSPVQRELRVRLLELVARHPGLLLEDKGAALALHYRRVPQLREAVRAAMAALVEPLAPALQLLQGDEVLEIRTRGLDKATAVESFLREQPFAGRMPVFVGDDLTDCDGFGAVRRHGGMTVAVGDRVSAEWRLTDTAAVRAWLCQIAAAARRRA